MRYSMSHACLIIPAGMHADESGIAAANEWRSAVTPVGPRIMHQRADVLIVLRIHTWTQTAEVTRGDVHEIIARRHALRALHLQILGAGLTDAHQRTQRERR